MKKDEDDQKKKTMSKIDEPDSDVKLNGDFGIIDYDDNRDNYKEEFIPRAKVRPIEHIKKNK